MNTCMTYIICTNSRHGRSACASRLDINCAWETKYDVHYKHLHDMCYMRTHAMGGQPWPVDSNYMMHDTQSMTYIIHNCMTCMVCTNSRHGGSAFASRFGNGFSPARNQWCHACGWVMSHVWVSHSTRMNTAPHHTADSEMVSELHIKSHVRHMRSSCHRYQCVMAHVQWMLITRKIRRCF